MQGDDPLAAEPEATGGITPDAQTPPAYYAPTPQQYPVAYQAQYPPPAAKPRRTGRTLLIIGLIVVLLLAVLGGSAVFVNASLTSTYGPEQAVTDYLAAQKRGDTKYMAANANFLKGDGSYNAFFSESELATMMTYPENTDISNVKVSRATVDDPDTRTVNVTMTWHAHQVLRNYTVHKDASRPHVVIYSSWRIDIPYTTIHLNLPNQAGDIAVDQTFAPSGVPVKDIQVIQGFHKVTMSGTNLYDTASADADGIDANPVAFFPTTLSAKATAAAVATVKKAFNTCLNPNTYKDCLGRVYLAPNKPGYIYYYTMPGYGDVYYTKYVWTLTSDPTKNMKLVVEANQGKVDASGTCAYTWTVDGSRKYYFKGTWTATLTTSGASFGYDLIYDCRAKKA